MFVGKNNNKKASMSLFAYRKKKRKKNSLIFCGFNDTADRNNIL